jgi:hypothetical protein
MSPPLPPALLFTGVITFIVTEERAPPLFSIFGH